MSGKNIIDIAKAKKTIRSRKFSKTFENELMDLLNRKSPDIKKLISDFDSKRNYKRFNYLKHRFPIFNDKIVKLKKFDDYPDLILHILVAKILEEKMGSFYEELYIEVDRLNDYIKNKRDKAGKKVYNFLISGRRGISRKILEKELKKSIKNIAKELKDYKNESEAYAEREINKQGLITNDAVKCLTDFSGRTFPFLRTITLQIKKGDSVLEVGVGTGILSIATILAGAKKVVGVELNPITCLLAKIIKEYLEKNKVIPKNSIDILWGDALEFGSKEYKEFKNKQFDVLISENIYTGMFFELQMKIISNILRNNLIRREEKLVHGRMTLVASSAVIPEGMSSGAELVELSAHNLKTTNEVLLDLKRKKIKIRALTKDHIYDQLDFREDEVSSIISIVKFKILRNGSINAVNLSSTIRMMDGDYIDRNENKFLSNDSILILNKNIRVNKGDVIILGLAYNEADSIDDIILELRKMNRDGSVDDKYDARLNISANEHKNNINKFKRKNGSKHPINLKDLGDFEIVRSSSIYKGYERLWFADVDYMNSKGYGA